MKGINLSDFLRSMTRDSQESFVEILDVDIDSYKFAIIVEVLVSKNYQELEQLAILIELIEEARRDREQPPDFSTEPVDRCNSCLLLAPEFRFEREHKKNHGTYGLQCPRCGSLDIVDLDDED